MSSHFSTSELWQSMLGSLYPEAGIRILACSYNSQMEYDEITSDGALPAELEAAFFVTPITNRNGVAVKYSVPYDSCWAILKASVAAHRYVGNVAAIKQLFMYYSHQDYAGLFKYLLDELDIQNLHCEGISLGDERITFSRRMLWRAKGEEERKYSPAPGVEYHYDPKLSSTSLSVAYTCQIVWDWIASVKIKSLANLIETGHFAVLGEC